MTKQKALDFLKKHKPLPSDISLTEELIEEYDDVREFFLTNPDKECIPYFLNSFGGKDGLGVYQLVEDVILKYSKEEVLPHLMVSLESKHDSIIYWSVEIASHFPDKKLSPQLSNLLKHINSDIRFFAAMSLGEIGSKETFKILQKHLLEESDEQVQWLINQVIHL